MNVCSLEEPSTIQESQQRESMKEQQYSSAIHDLRLEPIRIEADLMMLDDTNQGTKSHRVVPKDDDSTDSFDSNYPLPQDQQQKMANNDTRTLADTLWNRSCDPFCANAVVRFPPATGVDSDEYQLRFSRAREEMLEHLKHRLRAKCGSTHDSILSSDSAATPSTKNSSTSTTENIEQTAKALEHLLFRQCQRNIKVYQDRATLDARLRGLMMILVRRRMVKRTRQFKSTNGSNSSSDGGGGDMPTTVKNSTMSYSAVKMEDGSSAPARSSTVRTPGSTRGDVLITILGDAKYREIKNLLYEIRLVKMKKVAAFCGSQRCAPLRLHTSATTFDQQLPKVVRQLYFETPLVDCFEKYPLEKLAHLPWQNLINQAQSNLLAYQLWELQLNESTSSSGG